MIIARAALAAAAVIVPPATPDWDETEIVAAAVECDATDQLQDDGHSIVFDGFSVDDVMADPFTGLSCVTNRLFPDFMTHVMGATATIEGGLVVIEVDGRGVVTGRYPDGDIFLVIYDAEHDYPYR